MATKRTTTKPFAPKPSPPLERAVDIQEARRGHPLTDAEIHDLAHTVSESAATNKANTSESESTRQANNRDSAISQTKTNNQTKVCNPSPVDTVGGKMTITSTFGPRKTGIAGATKGHGVVDIRSPLGGKIYSPLEGTVAFIKPIGRAGNVIGIANKDGSFSTFGHTAAMKGISVGNKIRQGQQIGTSDSSGVQSAPHLHYVHRVPTTQTPLDASNWNDKNVGKRVDPLGSQGPLKDSCVKINFK